MVLSPGGGNQVKSLDTLLDVYVRSVGGNGTFLLNIPPTAEGLFHENDVRRLEELGDALREAFRENLLEKAALSASSAQEGHGVENLRQDSYDSWFQTEESVTHCVLEAAWEKPQVFRWVVEEKSSATGGALHLKAAGPSGKRYARWCPKSSPGGTKGDGLRVTIQDARVCPTLAFWGVY
ncbi:MAG: alpha-L-fucosidase [Acutalibacter sp.]